MTEAIIVIAVLVVLGICFCFDAITAFIVFVLECLCDLGD